MGVALQKLKLALTNPEESRRRLKPHQRNRTLLDRAVRYGYKRMLRSIPEGRVGDKVYSYIDFVVTHKRAPSRAKLFNDELYRIKTTDEILDPLRVFVSDKEFVKLYVKSRIGDEYNVPTIDVIRSERLVDEYVFPMQCCIKPTHASGPIVLRAGGEGIDRQSIKSWFHINYYREEREANYRFLKPKVIVEPFIFGRTNVEDYKFFCVKGVPKLVQLDVDRHIDHKRKYFDRDWQALDFSILYPKTDRVIERPANFSEMLSVAAELSKGFCFVRVDLYSDGTKVLVGEITHCAESGAARFIPPAAEKTVSDYLFG
jgi:hypothetical protein